MILRVFTLAVCILALYCVGSWIELSRRYQRVVYSNETYLEDLVQEKALYEECMSLTFHTKAGLPVDRRLGRPVVFPVLPHSP